MKEKFGHTHIPWDLNILFQGEIFLGKLFDDHLSGE